MHQQLWGYKVELKSVSRGTGGKKVEYHWYRRLDTGWMVPRASLDAVGIRRNPFPALAGIELR